MSTEVCYKPDYYLTEEAQEEKKRMPLIQASVTTPDNIVLNSIFGATITVNEIDRENFGNTQPLRQGGWFGFGKDGTKLRNLIHIASPEICFHCKVTANAPPQPGAEWQIGFAQNIYALSRSARYTGNVTRNLRQNPVHLPIRDGEDNCMLWYGWGMDEMKKMMGAGTYFVRVDDAPNQDFPVAYTGIIQDATTTVGGHQLTGTSGSDHFKTFAVAVQESTKSIIILGGFEWFVHWAGNYNSETRTWTPTSADVMPLSILPAQPNPIFANLGVNPVPLPFNPNEGCGFDNFQVEDNIGGWHSCGARGVPAQKNVSPTVWATTPQDLYE